MRSSFSFFPAKRRRAAAAGLVIAFAVFSCGRPLTRLDITAGRLEADVSFLASDALAGRKTGTPGIAAAEEFIAASFRDSGLRFAPGHDGYFLDFPLYEYGFDRKACRLSIKAGERVSRGIMESDFVPLPISADGLALGEIVFAGYGIEASEAGYDDYAGLDVSGKIVLAFRHEPARLNVRNSKGELDYSPRAYFTNKTKTAARHGARAILFVTDPSSAGKEADALVAESRLRLSAAETYDSLFPRGEEYRPLDIPVFQTSAAFAARLFAAAGLSADALEDALARGEKPRDFSLHGATGLVFCRRLLPPRELAARDVAGFLPGSDPAVADQWIVVGAHHDHLGSFSGTGDTIYNGADDNASGTSGVLELARVLASRAQRPRHSILFITFSGEEEWLLGSAAVFERHLLPAGDLKFMCNLDMIGRNPSQDFQVIVREKDTPLTRAAREFIARESVPADVLYRDPREVVSDDTEFQRRGASAFFFFAGLHPDYHGVDDEADRLDYQAMEKRVRLIYDFILFLDNR
jgi:hypothetical protein